MPTKLLSSTIGKSDTASSHMLSYKFTKENVFYPPPADPNNASLYVDRQGEDYQMQLKSLQDTMKSIREMDEEDRLLLASSNWDQAEMESR